MSDEPISNLPIITTPASGDLFVMVQAGVTSQLDYTNLITTLNGTYLPLAGGIMTGSLHMDGNAIFFNHSGDDVKISATTNFFNIEVNGRNFNYFDSVDTSLLITFAHAGEAIGDGFDINYDGRNGVMYSQHPQIELTVGSSTVESSVGFRVKHDDDLLDIMTFNADQEFTVKYFGNIELENNGAGTNIILSSNSDTQELELTGTLTFDSGNSSISGSSSDLILASSSDFIHTTSANFGDLILRTVRPFAGGLGNFKVQAFNDNSEIINYFNMNFEVDDATDGSEDSSVTISVYHNGLSEEIIGFNPHGNKELFVRNDIEFENNAVTGELILGTDTNDDLTYESRIVKTYSTQQTEILATTIETIDTDGEAEIADLAITKPTYPSGKILVAYHLLFIARVDAKSCDIIIKDNNVEVRRYSIDFPKKDIAATIDMSYIADVDGNNVTIFTDNASSVDPGDIDFIGTDTAVNGKVCRVETLEIG
jgi:hypothetical protein